MPHIGVLPETTTDDSDNVRPGRGEQHGFQHERCTECPDIACRGPTIANVPSSPCLHPASPTSECHQRSRVVRGQRTGYEPAYSWSVSPPGRQPPRHSSPHPGRRNRRSPSPAARQHWVEASAARWRLWRYCLPSRRSPAMRPRNCWMRRRSQPIASSESTEPGTRAATQTPSVAGPWSLPSTGSSPRTTARDGGRRTTGWTSPTPSAHPSEARWTGWCSMPAPRAASGCGYVSSTMTARSPCTGTSTASACAKSASPRRRGHRRGRESRHLDGAAPALRGMGTGWREGRPTCVARRARRARRLRCCRPVTQGRLPRRPRAAAILRR